MVHQAGHTQLVVKVSRPASGIWRLEGEMVIGGKEKQGDFVIKNAKINAMCQP